MAVLDLPATGTCELSTRGRRSGRTRRVETWYVVVDGHVVLTGTPGARDWLANLRVHPGAVLHVRGPARDVEVVATEVTDTAARRRFVAEAWRLQPWYADQSYTLEDWVAGSPVVVLTPKENASEPSAPGASLR
jgi:deazaflavin-dependent oxidoreductase (nitroreductase family)